MRIAAVLRALAALCVVVCQGQSGQPMVTTYDPQQDAANVAVTSNIVLTFNMQMQARPNPIRPNPIRQRCAAQQPLASGNDAHTC